MLEAVALADTDAALDQSYMEMALAEARRGAAAGEVPIGAVVVCDGRVLATAHNAPLALTDPTAHAEILALRDACRRHGNYRLTAGTLYVSVEPCLMCVGALIHARVRRVVFGCPEPKAGALGSVYDVGRDRRSNHQLVVQAGVGADAASELLRNFFRDRRGA